MRKAKFICRQAKVTAVLKSDLNHHGGITACWSEWWSEWPSGLSSTARLHLRLDFALK